MVASFLTQCSEISLVDIASRWEGAGLLAPRPVLVPTLESDAVAAGDIHLLDEVMVLVYNGNSCKAQPNPCWVP